MATVNVYEQYFAAESAFGGVARRGALVMLIADSGEGRVRYEAAVSFFPHADEEDFAVSWDAYFSRTVFEAPGRRSKKREAMLLETLQEDIDALCKQANATVYWDKPLKEARWG